MTHALYLADLPWLRCDVSLRRAVGLQVPCFESISGLPLQSCVVGPLTASTAYEGELCTPSYAQGLIANGLHGPTNVEPLLHALRTEYELGA